MYQKSLNWNTYSHEQQYSIEMAKSDFGLVTQWNNRITIWHETLRVKLEKNALSGAGGLVMYSKIPDGSEYELEFDVQFDSQFDWCRGGKVGFGFGIGNGNVGCNLPLDGSGGSFRLMWYNNPETNRVYLYPYLYHEGMVGPCGSHFNISYPTTGSIEKGKWYKIYMYIKSNTNSNTDGIVKMKINDETVIDQSFRWTTNHNKRLINRLSFHVFRGGKTEEWKSSTDNYIYFDNFIIRQINK
ncbi:hypothetical protein FQR65_LT02780 [Abscondita terminalis]|nr:hypothetical protein FQR65_LT02780 [Abscondita terminalis]